MDTFENIAKQYAASHGEAFEGYRFGFANRREFFFKVYYDLIFVDLEGNIPHTPPVAGGAVGFTIDKKTHEVEMLAFADLGHLEDTQRELEDVYDKLQTLNENAQSLSWLKSKYRLNSTELLSFKKKLSNAQFTKEHIIEELDDFIKKNR